MLVKMSPPSEVAKSVSESGAEMKSVPPLASLPTWFG